MKPVLKTKTKPTQVYCEEGHVLSVVSGKRLHNTVLASLVLESGLQAPSPGPGPCWIYLGRMAPVLQASASAATQQ